MLERRWSWWYCTSRAFRKRKDADCTSSRGLYTEFKQSIQLIRGKGRHCDNHHGMNLGLWFFSLHHFSIFLCKLTCWSHYCYCFGCYFYYTALHLLSLKFIRSLMHNNCQLLLLYIHRQLLLYRCICVFIKTHIHRFDCSWPFLKAWHSQYDCWNSKEVSVWA